MIGAYLHGFQSSHTWPQGRFIYIEVLAGVSILLALLWLLPFAGGFIHWPIDLVIAAAWLAAFVLLVNSIHNDRCAGRLFVWGETKSTCGRYRAGEGFAFLSMIFWFVSALVGIWFVHRARTSGAAAGGPGSVNDVIGFEVDCY